MQVSKRTTRISFIYRSGGYRQSRYATRASAIGKADTPSPWPAIIHGFVAGNETVIIRGHLFFVLR